MINLMHAIFALCALALCVLGSVRVARAIWRPLSAGEDPAALVALRAGTHWPRLRRGARAVAVLVVVTLTLGTSPTALAAHLGAAASMAGSLLGVLALVTVVLVSVAFATVAAWAAEQSIQLALDFLDASLLRAAPRGRAEPPPVDRIPLE